MDWDGRIKARIAALRDNWEVVTEYVRARPRMACQNESKGYKVHGKALRLNNSNSRLRVRESLPKNFNTTTNAIRDCQFRSMVFSGESHIEMGEIKIISASKLREPLILLQHLKAILIDTRNAQ